MRRWLALSVLLFGIQLPAAALAQGINPDALIIQAESGGNPTATNPASTASGLFGDINSTWAQALAACGGACGTIAQFPTAASAPAANQIAANNALINQVGFAPWLCPGCDAPFANQVAAAGGPGAFQTTGLDTNPADFLAANTEGALAALGGAPGAGAGGTDFAGGDAGAGAGGGELGGIVALGAGPTTVTDLPGTGSGAGSGILDQIAAAFQGATTEWQAGLFNIAQDLFWILAGIELMVSLYLLVMGGGTPDWSDVAFTIIHWLFPVGLFWWLLQNGSGFSLIIINSLREAATTIGGTAITPSAVFWVGVNVVSTIWNNMHGFLGTIEEIPVMLAAIPMIISFALAAVWMLMALIEAYVKIGLAALFLAFAPLRWTRNIAVSLLMSCLAVGFKLLTISIIVGLGSDMVKGWAENAAGLSFQGIFIMLGASIAFAALVKILPDSVERVVYGYAGSLADYHQARNVAVGAAAAAAAPVAAMAGFTAVAYQAIQAAAERVFDNSQQGQQSSLPRSAQLAIGMGQATASAAGSEISGRIAGLYRGGAASSAMRMAMGIAQGRRVDAAQRSRPVPPSNNAQGGP